MTPALSFERVTKTYGSGWGRTPKRALDGLSLEVRQGEVFGFLGRNGAGKTTAIHIAMGLMRATSGSGSMLGCALGDAKARRRVGFVPENPAFYPRSARTVVRFNAMLNGIGEREATRRADEMLERVGLSNDAYRKVTRFSRGMLQRVGLAQALVNDPELLVLDEPTSALDPIARAQVREILLWCKREGKTVFLSSHILAEIEDVCDRVAFVAAGKTVRTGTMRDLLEDASCFEIVFEGAGGALAEAKGEEGRWRVVVPASEQRQAIEKVWASGGSVVSVSPFRKRLEEVFVEATGERTGSA